MLHISVKNTENQLNTTVDNYTATVKYYGKIVKITDFIFFRLREKLRLFTSKLAAGC